MHLPTEFYTGAVVDPADLLFRDKFIAELWRELRTKHVVISAPRRMGKTSVLDYLVENPQEEFLPIPVFVQDVSHPSEFLLHILDLFYEKHPKIFSSIFRKGKSLIGKVIGSIDSASYEGFKIQFRKENPDWRQDWKKIGDEFFSVARASSSKLLLLVDEFPDMILNMKKEHPDLVRPFLGWFRGHRQTLRANKDSIRWLLCGSVNLSSTLDSLDCLDEINDIDDVPLPVLSTAQVKKNVHKMLSERGVEFDASVPGKVAKELGRPVPLFMQMVTQPLERTWRSHQKKLTSKDVSIAFSHLIISSTARDKLQHFYSRIEQYYEQPKRGAAYSILACLSLSTVGILREKLFSEFERILHEQHVLSSRDEKKRLFNQLLRDLENDFYVAEVRPNIFDFASGTLKQWWKKFYA